MSSLNVSTSNVEISVAIIGMAGRFPQAATPRELWARLCAGEECIQIQQGAAAELDRADGHVVHASSNVAGIELFDAQFFGYSAREADLIDPQQRIFLECAWEALEDAGYSPTELQGRVGVFGGTGVNTYATQVAAALDGGTELAGLQLTLGNDKDYLTTRVSYKLNLRGPSVAVQTACSSSLVATHLACQSLIDLECDLALAGGVSIRCPSPDSYRYTPGGIFSPDGHCRSFDAMANGTVLGNGAGMVVLKRLARAIEDRDHIYAVIRGSAINNDGHDKAGFTAPSLEGQARVIRAALSVAEVPASSLTYVETHGTATPLGDAIEIAALKEVFGTQRRTTPCLLGAIKTNIGHLDTAAGIAGLIKTALCLEHGRIPPTLHFRRPHPALSARDPMFQVAAGLEDWPRITGSPRRAGVSSFGIGGTNAHAVLEEAPAPPPRPEEPAGTVHVLPLSARTAEALARARQHLAAHLERNPHLPLRDVAYTLQVGRTSFKHRVALTCTSLAGAIATLTDVHAGVEHVTGNTGESAPVVFMFPGQGSEYPGMAARLYAALPLFRAHFDRCMQCISTYGGPEIAADLRQQTSQYPAGEGALKGTLHAQLSLFAVEYATAKALIELKVRPAAAIGHSLGEITAACICGVFTLEAAVQFLMLRGRLMLAQTGGAMLAVALPEAQAAGLCEGSLQIAAANGPSLTVLSGRSPDVVELRRRLQERNIACGYVNKSQAFHSRLMEPCVEALGSLAARLDLRPPSIPFVGIDGNWQTADAARDPQYWARQVVQTVRFGAGIGAVAGKFPGAIFLEAGPQHTLSKLAQQTLGSADPQATPVPTFARAGDHEADMTHFATSLAHLWTRNIKIDWTAWHSGMQRHVALPTYPFERSRHWAIADSASPTSPRAQKSAAAATRLPLDRWVSMPVWIKAPPARVRPRRELPVSGSWLVFVDGGLGDRIAAELRATGHKVIEVGVGADYTGLLCGLGKEDRPHTALHFCTTAQGPATWDTGLLSVMQLARASQEANLPSLDIYVFGTELASVHAGETVDPAKAMLFGAAATLPLEMPAVSCAIIDLPTAAAVSDDQANLTRAILEELHHVPPPYPLAYRQTGRWMRQYLPLTREPVRPDLEVFRRGGTYLLTGGCGGLGRGLARSLVEQHDAQVILLGRSAQTTAIPELDPLDSQILRLSADVTDVASLARAVDQARARFGEINGAFHLAGIPGGGLIQTRPITQIRKVLAPKVLGAANLLEVLGGAPLDFLVLFSSISSLAGALGQCDYSAANAFLDALPFSAAAAKSGFPIITLAWDAWQSDTWQDKLLSAVPEAHRAIKAHRDTYGIRFAEGLEIMRRCVASGLEHGVVTTRELATVVAAQRNLNATALSAWVPASGSAAPQATASPPTGELLSRLTAIWNEVLGMPPAGRSGRFLDLGGHSLLAIQMAARIKKELNLQIELKWLLGNPSIEELEELISQRTGEASMDVESSIDAEVGAILSEIEESHGITH